MDKEPYLEKSQIARLFKPDMTGEDLAQVIADNIRSAAPLLDSALIAARAGYEAEHSCGYCFNVEALLEGYKAAINLVLDEAERKPPKARKGA